MNNSGSTILISAFLLGSMVLAADKPVDLSGTWALEKSEQSFTPIMT